MNARWISHEVLRALKEDSGRVADLAGRLPGLRPRQISNGLYTLRKNGMAELFGRGWHITAEGLCAPDEPIVPGAAGQVRAMKIPRKRSFRQRAWQALRRKGGKASIPDLLRVLDADSPMDVNNLGAYFRRLAAVGLLVRLKRRVAGDAPTSPGYITWVVPAEIGPKAPIWRTGKNEIYDPNTGTTYPLPPKGATP
ncbi:MAG: hypothetical protein HQM01_15990 [Magnetococcales bacterium]|nr:hypothetical protein [Magnetococcales bacterium]